MMFANKFKDLSLFGIVKTSLPMMISAMSAHFMIILDQLILANYSTAAMISVTSAELWCAVVQCFMMSTTMIAGVLAGYHNGAKQYDKSSSPVWQMVWFSFLFLAVSIPNALCLGKFFIPDYLHSDGLPYFKIVMVFSPLFGIIYALSSFFVSIGRGFLVTISVIIANIAHFFIDIVLVFGYFGMDWFVGTTGAAIGTVSGMIINIIILMSLFLTKQMRQKYGSSVYKINFSIMKTCLKLGVPAGMGHILEMIAWSVLYVILAKMSPDYALLQTVAAGVNIFMLFLITGLEKGMIAMTSNFLGADRRSKIPLLMKKGFQVHFIFMSILIVPFFIFPEILMAPFIKFDVGQEVISNLKLVLQLVWLFLIVDGMVWVVAGILEGGGDVNFVMLVVGGCIWLFSALPAMIFFKLGTLNVNIAWISLTIASVVAGLVMLRRYKSNKWIHLNV